MNKHFEPVTARSLAEKIVDKAQQFSPWQTRASQKNAIESIIEPHIRKPSDDDKSVPARCEEAYNEAIKLIKGFAGEFTHEEFMSLSRKADKLIKKPNPFKEADIVHKDEVEPTLLPFSLEDARNGSKVVTRKGLPARIVADDLNYDAAPIAAIIHDEGKKMLFRYEPNGFLDSPKENDYDLFILKEPETIEINIFRNKFDGTYSTSAYESKPLHGEELIKTIKTTI